ncbi:hypothetical protein D3C80_866700 [compost metagenome]
MQAAVMGDLGATAHCLTCAGSFDCADASVGNDIQQWRTQGHRTGRARQQSVFAAIAQDYDGDQAGAVLCDQVQVKTNQRLTPFDALAIGHQRFEAAALQLYGIKADVHKDLGAVVGTQGQGVQGFCQVNDGAGAGCLQAVVERVDGDAIAQGAAGEHRVGHLVQWQQGAFEGCMEGDVLVVGHAQDPRCLSEFGSLCSGDGAGPGPCHAPRPGLRP